MTDVGSLLANEVGPEHVLAGRTALLDYGHDEALGLAPGEPAFAVRPGSAAEVAAVLRVATDQGLAVTARGAGTGMSGAAIPRPGGLVVCFDRMDRILEIDTANHVAVVQPGASLAALDAATAAHGLVYPVFPGEMSASLGGTIATNAGGIRAVKYGVTRHHVLGLEAVLASGDVLRTGGKYVKVSSGYDLTQLLIGSEGTLALTTEATVRLYPRLPCQATLLAPFSTLAEVTAAVPRIVVSGVGPLILEYVDMLTMAAITQDEDIDLGIPEAVVQTAQAYLVVVLEGWDTERLDGDVAECAELLSEAGAVDVYVPPASAAHHLIDAREKAFWTAKRAGAGDIVDAVVPRAAMAVFLGEVAQIAARRGQLVIGTGHVGDGNVHLALFERDAAVRGQLMREILAAARDGGGAVSGEHGIGTAKASYFRELTDPVAVSLMRKIKNVFDPEGLLNPGVIFG